MRKPANKNISLKTYKNFTDITSKACEASHKVLEENKRLGIPSPFSLQGRIYYLMPDGEIIMKKSKDSSRRDKKAIF
ncbi:MAG: hypothetical protein P9M13_10305 [Candidatus Ancaeobacter aquaticus]|nr:hypothetical protein [Candidatus Ancaeobacter aquaticus]